MHIDIVSVAPATTIKDHFPLNWMEEKYSDKIWGKCLRKSRMVNPENISMEGMRSEEEKTFLMARG